MIIDALINGLRGKQIDRVRGGKRIAADPAFLTQLKRNVKRKREEQKDWLQESDVNPENPMAITMLTCKQIEITTLQDLIRRVRNGCYHLL